MGLEDKVPPAFFFKERMPGPTIQDVLDKLDELAQNQLYARQEFNLVGVEVESFSGDQRTGQTFTPQRDYYLTRVRFLLSRRNYPGTLILNIYAADGDGKPEGSSLGSANIDGNLLVDVTTTDQEWYEFLFIRGITLVTGIMYAMTLHTGGDASNYVSLLRDLSNPYSGGTRIGSYDGGATWYVPSSEDLVFETYSGPNVNLGFQPPIIT